MAIIKVKIDVTKIEKARLFEGKNGAKYLDMTLLGKDEPDQYGNDFMVIQDVTKEERLAGVKGPILGNGKKMEQQPRQNVQRATKAVHKAAEDAKPVEDDDVPF